MKRKGICVIEILIAFSIIIASFSFYLLVQSNISSSKRKMQDELKQNACINSIYSYVDRSDISKLLQDGDVLLGAGDIFGEYFDGYYIKMQPSSKKWINRSGQSINATLIYVDIIKKGKSIKHLEIIKELI